MLGEYSNMGRILMQSLDAYYYYNTSLILSHNNKGVAIVVHVLKAKTMTTEVSNCSNT